MKRPIFLIIGGAAAAALAAGLLGLGRDRGGEGALRLYGNVDIREVQLAFRQPGRIARMAFDEGDRVSAGQSMAALDAQPYQEALAVAEAQVQLARAELEKLRRGLRPQEIDQAREVLNQARALAAEAELDFQRQSGLLDSGASSRRTVDAARAAHERAAAGVKAAEAALSQAAEGFRREDIAAGEARLAAAEAARAQAATALADTELLAPSAGTVIARVREPGSMVASQSAVYSLSLDTPVYVRAYVGEPDLGRVAPGMPVRVRSDSSQRVYRGRVGFVSPRAEFTPKTVETADLRTDLVYRLRIVVEDADEALRQGMPVTIDVEAPAAPGKGP
ncbi:MAG TPA: secretion protein HlyD [Planctomycetota bacterium]|jgi:HlyD family secretion protein|nr:secretion protein HlyD [Planctomycetota bacterium]OQC21907.1 MAG: Multidrug resistance protein MdtN [Planctomycetes bacterium ADurb.Bin069]HNS00005.1 secretion protein HlyD [Planctomycetota bacterium]HNU27397.1 secretion protein HlyD [Planctomycetota bacterium]HOE29592.1 secretion protein HlyD [Planctomycetota bacterium]